MSQAPRDEVLELCHAGCLAVATDLLLSLRSQVQAPYAPAGMQHPGRPVADEGSLDALSPCLYFRKTPKTNDRLWGDAKMAVTQQGSSS